jgi:hypothetical protein
MRMTWRVSSSLFGMLTLVAFSAMLAWPQATSTGTVSGQVTDQQGAAVPAAEVQLTDIATNATQKTLTNDAGRYIFVNVSPGMYNIKVSKQGFTTFRVAQQKVNVGSATTINAALQVGSVTNVVEVVAAPGAELQVTNATVGTTLSGQSLVYLPNLSREAASLALLQPGVSPDGSVAGAIYDQNTFQLDGGNNSNDMDGSMNVYTPSYASNGAPTGVMPTPIESIEEFKVGTANQTADFNGSAGAQVQMVTKRGTNQFHGSLYEYYFATDVGAANNWVANHTPAKGHPFTPLPITHTNRFGGSIGGVLLPRLLGGKTYFFFNYEGFRYPNSATIEKPVPTALMRAGVIQINQGGQWVPYNLNPNPVTVNGVTYQPAVCPSGACDPRGIGLNSFVSQIWNKQMPLPNDPQSGDHFNTQGYLSTIGLPTTSNFFVGRIDHDFGDRNRFFASYRDYRFIRMTSSQVDIGGALPGDTLGQPVAQSQRPQVPDYWVGGLTSTIKPTLTNDFRFSYLRNYWAWGTAGAPAQLPALGGALEIGGESSSALIPYNVNTQSVRTRFWDGQDYMYRDDVSWIHGNHLVQFGGNFEHNYDYHQRNDNGGGIMAAAVYQITGGSSVPGINFDPKYIPSAVPTSQYNNYQRLYNEVLGIVSQSQNLYTRVGPQLSLQPLGTPAFDQSIIDFYNIYATDTWHMRPSLTLTYGLGYQVETPPYEVNGKQVLLTDAAGKPIVVQDYLNARQAAAMQGQVYNPTLAFTTVRNVQGDTKYPYEPFYGGLSPRVAVAWNPKFNSGLMGKIFGDSKTVIRGGYGRIFSRMNGVEQVLVPLLGTGLLQPIQCIGVSSSGQCLGNGGVTPATAFRIGTDGTTAPLAAATPTLSQPFLAGVGTNAFAGAGSVLDPAIRPATTDNFTLSIQRELTTNVLFEVGYIGRKISHEWLQTDLDAVPYMTALGGQSFAQAYAQSYFALTAGGTPAPQPFFEAALGGPNSAYCKGFGSCTAAVAKNFGSQIKNTQVYDLWAGLNRVSSWTLGRTMPSSPFPAGAGDPSGQMSGIFFDDSLGYGNYNAAYFSLRLRDFHGITAQSNFTWGRALGTGNQVQATSEYTQVDPWNVGAMYGPQFFDYKFVYNLNLLYEPKWFRSQRGVLGHVLGGWRIAPIFTFHTGAPEFVYGPDGNCQGFGEGNCATETSLNGAVLAANYTGGTSPIYNTSVAGSASGAGTNSNYANGGDGVNMFSNPAQVYSEFRPCVLGFDHNCGGNGFIRGMSFWNVDASVSKDMSFWKEGRIGATLIFQFTNIFNHTQLVDPYLDLSDPANFGVLGAPNPNGGVANTPRQMEFGLRIHF